MRNIPVKSCESRKLPERTPLLREPLQLSKFDDTKCYQNCYQNAMKPRMPYLKLEPWTSRVYDNGKYLELNLTQFLIPKFT